MGCSNEIDCFFVNEWGNINGKELEVEGKGEGEERKVNKV